jgi:hypothetical protein
MGAVYDSGAVPIAPSSAPAPAGRRFSRGFYESLARKASAAIPFSGVAPPLEMGFVTSLAHPDSVRCATLLPHSRRGRMARHLEALAGIADPRAVHFQDRKVLVEEVAGQNILSVRCEPDRFR